MAAEVWVGSVNHDPEKGVVGEMAIMATVETVEAMTGVKCVPEKRREPWCIAVAIPADDNAKPYVTVSTASYIAASVRACVDAGLSTAALESGVVADLVAACKAIDDRVQAASRGLPSGDVLDRADSASIPVEHLRLVRAALAKVKEGNNG